MNDEQDNSGNYNSGDCNSGYFNTLTPHPTFFDVPWSGTWGQANDLVPYVDLPVCCEWVGIGDMTDAEKAEFPSHATIGGYLKSHPIPLNEAFPLAWAKMSDSEKQIWIDLPNFDAEKFLTITGVDVRKNDSGQSIDINPKVIEIDGVKYQLIPVA